MSIHRTKARRDSNESAIIEALRSVGASVQQLSAKGCPDLLVGFRGENYLLEVKTVKGKLTEDEDLWFFDWHGQAQIVRTVEDALEAIGAIS
jgi:hypothetical protein